MAMLEQLKATGKYYVCCMDGAKVNQSILAVSNFENFLKDAPNIRVLFINSDSTEMAPVERVN